jgi:Flp pilus assembly protein TadD
MATVDSLLAQIWNQHQQGNLAGAEAGYRQLIEKAPNSANAHVYLGIVLFDQKRFVEAIDSYRKALQLQSFFPIAWNNLGNALRMIGENDQADDAFAKALEQKPDYTNAMKNRGTLWTWAGEIDLGMRWFRKALELAADDYELHRNLGIIYLLQGRFAQGWPEYRWRWKAPGMLRPNLPCPIWQGESLRNKRIFVYPEQGLGDTIQFARMIPRLRESGAEVVLGCDPKMVPLLSGLDSVGEIVPTGGSTEAVDYHASLVDVVDYLWTETTEIDGNPYLSVPQNLIGYWGQWLSKYPGKRIGLCWQGNPNHHADVYRSMPLDQLRPLMEIPNIHWISLQFGAGVDQQRKPPFADKVIALPKDIDRSGGAFLDTAAVIKNLDLVITVDTSVGHLAGALGTPTWLLINKVPDWRWGLEGERTPWYENHRLWRQTTAADWKPVVDAVHSALTSQKTATI